MIIPVHKHRFRFSRIRGEALRHSLRQGIMLCVGVIMMGSCAAPTRNMIVPTWNLIVPTRNWITPTGNLIIPTRNVIVPTRNWITPTGNMIVPTSIIAGPLRRRSVEVWAALPLLLPRPSPEHQRLAPFRPGRGPPPMSQARGPPGADAPAPGLPAPRSKTGTLRRHPAVR